jgi:undecaprenyl-diphosphatase
MLDLIKAIIYGIVEGITEWLPISSTGHLLLVEQFLPFNDVSEGFFEMFDVVIQLGAIMAVVILFFKQIWPFALTQKERKGRTGAGSFLKMDIVILWLKILVSCVPAAVIGLLFDEELEALFYNPISIAIALMVFGVAFILVENHNRGKKPKISRLRDITYQTALWIGVFQVLAAVFPGTSRSGATIIGALLIGVSRTVAAEYTFFLAIPVMFGASLLKVVKFGFDFSGTELFLLAVGTVIAFLVSWVSLRFLMNYVKKHNFKVFGWYRIALGCVVLLYFGWLA